MSTSFSLAEAAEKPSASTAVAQKTIDLDYQKAADQCYRLLHNPAQGGNREDWLKSIQEIERIYRQDPQSRIAPACLYLTARMHHAIHQRFHRPADLDQAVAVFSNVVSLFPQSSEAAESLFALAQIEQTNGNLRGAAKTYYKLVHGYPFSNRKAQAEEQLRQLTVIAQSLAARKQGKKVAPVVKMESPQPVVAATPSRSVTNLPSLPEKKPQEKMVLPPLEPVIEPLFTPRRATQPPVIAMVKEPEKPKPSQLIVPASPPVLAEKKPQQKIILPLPVPPKVATPSPAVKEQAKEDEESWLAKISFPLFGDDEEEEKPIVPTIKPIISEPVKPVPPPPKPEPPKPVVVAPPAPEKAKETNVAAQPPLQEREQSKILVSELKIASVEPEKPAVTPAPVAPTGIIKPTPQPEPPKVEVKQEKAQPPVIVQPEEKIPEKSALAELLPIQHWSSDSYSRVAVSVSSLASYQAELPDKNSKQPGRLRLEFKKSHVAPAYRAPMTVNAGLIKTIQAEQTDDETVRVSLELAADADCKIFSLNDPFRVVVDLHGVKPEETVEKTVPASPKELVKQENKDKPAAVQEQIKIKPEAAENRSLTLAQQLGLGIRRIMIDPGHGGKDVGATGFSLEEKNLVLDIAKRVRELLQKENYEVLLTREQDAFLPLEERTALANTKGADLFLSIHVNAHPKAWVKGVETYYLNLAANPEAMRVAALENATSSRSMSEMQGILADLMKNTKIDESSLLAEFIQTSMADGLRRYKIKNLGVKKAPFYVLIGAQMPAVLAEISFISNKEEALLLKDDQYLQAIAKQIAVGVVAYIEHRRTEATAALKTENADEHL
ncbi:N-acetylmuramoyl-L-alanine amidase [Candidatus Electronema sp. PJ]|uniref:N-acetylmuramoyl-L-alanine amidase n=1 Tax=Candidatus Electronema sp. PJ TaxID=3401572 RepID=UPI003AA89730